MNSTKGVPYASGIDTLYYFAKSGGYYDEFYQNILTQIDTKKKEFEALNYAYQDNEIVITLNDIEIKYSGKGRDGFLWFNHEFFRAGFKDSLKSSNINDIRIQLNAIGIYTLGLKSLIEYVNTKFLKGALLKQNHFPVTRLDANMFLQHNFNYLHKEMVVSKKKNHSATIGERSSGYELETYYVGKKPFMLRIYNKLQELKGASQAKQEVMYNYFATHGFDTNEPIFNVEFEMHREFLKEYGIDTIEDALKRSKQLFELGCDLIKFIDPASITQKQLNSSNRRRAELLPIWEFISTHYDNDVFMQITTPLEKIAKISYRYNLEDARKPIKRVITRLLMHNNAPTLLFLYDVLQNTKKDYHLRCEMKKIHLEYSHPVRENFAEDLKAYSDEGLQNFLNTLDDELSHMDDEAMNGSSLYNEVFGKFQEVHHEMTRRGLKCKPTPLYDIDDEELPF